MKRSKFNLSHYKLATLTPGVLTPVGCVEMLPGDTIHHSVSSLIRVTPPATPVMHRCDMQFDTFFVPTRLMMDELVGPNSWEKFITGSLDEDDPVQLPTVSVGRTDGGATTEQLAMTKLADYLGMPPSGVIDTPYSVLQFPFAAYNMIYNEWYRDQDFVDPLPVAGPHYSLQRVAWHGDYFTSARLTPQKGPDITIGLGAQAPLVFPNDAQFTHDHEMGLNGYRFDGETPYARTLFTETSSNSNVQISGSSPGGTLNIEGATTAVNLAPGLADSYADLSGATAISLLDFRDALARQRFAEARSRYGSRLTEYYRYLGVKSSDGRLQRPELLGRSRSVLQFSEVLNTTGTGLGDLGGHGISSLRTRPHRYFCEEHGWLITVAFMRPQNIYANALPRQFTRRTYTDYWQRELEHIGQQAILNQEVQPTGNSDPDVGDRGIWGYNSRYAEYRSMVSQIAGEFRTTLSDWHLARIFDPAATAPPLNESFLTCSPSNRIYTDTSGTTDKLWLLIRHRLGARRLVSRSAAPRTF